MNKDELTQARSNIETQFNNLNSNTWVAQELRYLQGKYDALTELINNLEGAENATSSTNRTPAENSNVNNRRKTL